MNFQSCEMDARSNAQFWFDVIGDTDDEDSDFEGFTDADLVKIDAADAESDLDLDFEAAQEEFEAEGEDSDSDNEGSSIDLLPRGDWSTHLRNVSDGDFKENVGVFHDLEVGAEPLQYFQLFFPDYVFLMIATETNRYAEEVQEEKGADSKWRPTTTQEMKLYTAVNVMMGIHILPHVENYWSTDDKLNVPCISRLTSRTRFEKLGQYLRVNDRADYAPRGQPGFYPLFKVRQLPEIFRERCSSLRKPGRAVSIDEAMVKFNGRLFFKRYMKSKPTPWDIKVWCSADPTSGYLLDFTLSTLAKLSSQ